MTIEQFAALKKGEFFHAINWGDEWQALENKELHVKAICTKTGKFFNEGTVEDWNKDMGQCTDDFLNFYDIGKSPNKALQ